jgi:hypothetical protein
MSSIFWRPNINSDQIKVKEMGRLRRKSEKMTYAQNFVLKFQKLMYLLEKTGRILKKTQKLCSRSGNVD